MKESLVKLTLVEFNIWEDIKHFQNLSIRLFISLMTGLILNVMVELRYKPDKGHKQFRRKKEKRGLVSTWNNCLVLEDKAHIHNNRIS